MALPVTVNYIESISSKETSTSTVTTPSAATPTSVSAPAEPPAVLEGSQVPPQTEDEGADIDRAFVTLSELNSKRLPPAG